MNLERKVMGMLWGLKEHAWNQGDEGDLQESLNSMKVLLRCVDLGFYQVVKGELDPNCDLSVEPKLSKRDPNRDLPKAPEDVALVLNKCGGDTPKAFARVCKSSSVGEFDRAFGSPRKLRQRSITYLFRVQPFRVLNMEVKLEEKLEKLRGGLDSMRLDTQSVDTKVKGMEKQPSFSIHGSERNHNEGPKSLSSGSFRSHRSGRSERYERPKRIRRDKEEPRKGPLEGMKNGSDTDSVELYLTLSQLSADLDIDKRDKVGLDSISD
ncbi:hypothetical protein CR513_25752, partial [Mucuna pruriens]